MKLKVNGESHQTWLWKKLGERCVGNLRKHGFDAHFVRNGDEARTVVLDMIGEWDTFGFGGSDTIRSLGIVEALRDLGKTIHDHWREGLSREEELETRLKQGRCDCFLCSANGVSATGEVVNVDGMGNRTGAMSFGPKKVVIVAGMNKVTHDLEGTLRRVREVAGPMRARSLGLETPCAETGMCSDCNSPQRICRITTILHRKPALTDVAVILVNQSLGF